MQIIVALKIMSVVAELLYYCHREDLGITNA